VSMTLRHIISGLQACGPPTCDDGCTSSDEYSLLKAFGAARPILHVQRMTASTGGTTAPGWVDQRQLRADQVRRTASIQIDVADARRMNMRPYKQCSRRARESSEQMSLPRNARLARKNAPENGAIEDTNHKCRAQRDQ